MNGSMTGSRFRRLIVAHRSLAVLLPVSLVVASTIALAHGPAVVPPPNQGLLADPLESLASQPAWRVVWWLWLAGALVLIELTARRIGAGDLAILAVGAIVLVLPTTSWAFGWAGSNGPLIFFGALAVWLALRAAEDRRSAWWAVLCCLVAGVFGASAVLIALVVLVMFMSSRTSGRRWPLTGIGLLAIIAAALLPSIGSVTGIAPLPAIANAGSSVSLGPAAQAIGVINSMLEVGLYSIAQAEPQIPGVSPYLYYLLGWALIAGVVVAFLQARRGRIETPLVIASASSVLLAGLVLVLLARVLAGDWLIVTPIGAAGLVPVFAIVTTLALRSRAAAALILGCATVYAVLTMVALVTAA